jgi:hypothetical protein
MMFTSALTLGVLTVVSFNSSSVAAGLGAFTDFFVEAAVFLALFFSSLVPSITIFV